MIASLLGLEWSMSYYKYHVFFCVNQRNDGRDCCQDFEAKSMRDYLKARVKENGLAGPGGIRINTAGCLDRCEMGPVMVVYPQAVWYTFVDQADIDEIFESHLQQDQLVKRLLLQ